MKPSFALNLSHDGIGLFARRGAGWELLGEVALDAPDLTEQLGQLRQRALACANGVLTTKVIIPASQILYTEVDAPGPRPAMRRKQIADALEGATPYAVDDLIFDWSGRGDRVKVAVVARETLAEAEGFAEDWGFAPVSFVAAPERGAFGGEPWFGAAAAGAETHLPDGEKIERDQDPVPVSDAPLAAEDDASAYDETEAQPETETIPLTDAAPVEDIADMAFLPEAPSVGVPPAEAAQHDEITPVAPEPEAAVAGSAPEAPPPDIPPVVEEPATEAVPDTLFTAETVQETPPAPEDAPASEPEADPGIASEESQVTPDVPEISVETAPQETPALRDDAPAAPKPDGRLAKTGATASEAIPSLAKLEKAVAALRHEGGPHTALPVLDDLAGDTAEPPTAFATRRTSTLSANDPLPGAARRLGGAARLHPTIAPERRAQYITSVEAGVTAPGLALPDLDLAEAEAPPEQADRKTRSGLGKAARSTVALGGSASRSLAQSLRPATTGAAAKSTPAEPSVFGAPRGKVVGGKPRHLGAMLVGGLVGLMAVAALWSSFLSDPEPAPGTQTPEAATPTPDTNTAMAPEDGTEAPAPATDTAEIPADGVDVPSPDEGIASDTPAADTSEPVAQEPAAVEPVPVAPADTATQSTFSSQTAPAIAGTEQSLSDNTLARPDPALQQPAGLALAPVAPSADSVPTAPVPPPPFDELARVNPDGNYEPTVQGVVTPGGYTLYSGRPDRVPGDRPDAVARAAAAAAAPAVAPADTAAEPAAPEPYADPALSKFRPRLRPAAVDTAAAAAAAKAAEPAAPAVPAAAPDDGALLGPALSPAERKRLAALRPVSRPKAVASLAAAAVPAPVEETPAVATFADATDLAVTVSRRPPGRPRDFSGSVDKALAAALAAEAAAQPAPQVKVAAAAPAPQAAPAPRNAPAPAVELDEPEPVGPLKNLPTSASVAKQATQNNVLDLGSINLIGVYGSSKDRRALVRMPNGRFVKVSVGDRLDGGKVTAIGDGQLTYQKGTRPITLKLVKGG